MANPLYVPLNIDIGDTSGKLTVPWRQFFQALNNNIGPMTGAITSLTGDVTATGPGASAAIIANDAVTYAKMQNVSAASRLLGRGSASGAGNVEEITVSTGLTMTGTTLTATGSGGTVTNTGTLTDNQVIIGDGTTVVTALGSYGTAGQVLTSTGSPNAPTFQNWLSDVRIHWAFTSTITNAQFLTLPSTYIQLVATPGATNVLVPLWAQVHIDATAGAYTNVDGYPVGGIGIAYGDWDAECFCFVPFDGTSTRGMLFPQALIPDATVLINGYADYTNVALNENLPLKLIAWNDSGNFTGGHASNSFRIGVAYAILNYSTGVFS